MSRPLVAYIDRAAFAENIAFLQSKAPESEMILVVKADAYGHGVQHLLPSFQGRRIAVSCAEEALELFRLGFDGEVVLLEGVFGPDCVASLKGHKVSLVVHHEDQLAWMRAAGYQGKVWLKIDSGMHRLGLDEDGYLKCLDQLAQLPDMKLESLMTHFASADDRRSGSVNEQLSRFNGILSRNKPQGVSLSLCNSAGLLLCPEAQQDIVRPGIALYGGSPAPKIANAKDGLSPVMSLESQVIAVREISIGETVGYGDTWTALRPTKIATVAIGYGDGYPRLAPSGTPVLVNGRRTGLAGRVSMDMITVDVTDLKEVRVGDPVELWGKNLSIDEVADAIGTISYELSTSLTARVPRILVS